MSNWVTEDDPGACDLYAVRTVAGALRRMAQEESARADNILIVLEELDSSWAGPSAIAARGKLDYQAAQLRALASDQRMQAEAAATYAAEVEDIREQCRVVDAVLEGVGREMSALEVEIGLSARVAGVEGADSRRALADRRASLESTLRRFQADRRDLADLRRRADAGILSGDFLAKSAGPKPYGTLGATPPYADYEAAVEAGIVPGVPTPGQMAGMIDRNARGGASMQDKETLATWWRVYGSDSGFVQGLFDALGRTGADPSKVVDTWLSEDDWDAEVTAAMTSALAGHARDKAVARSVMKFLGPEGYGALMRGLSSMDLPVVEPGDQVADDRDRRLLDLGTVAAAMAAVCSRTTGTWLSGAQGGRALARDGQVAAATFYLSTLGSPGRTPKDGGKEGHRYTVEFDGDFLVAAAKDLIADPFCGPSDNPALNPTSSIDRSQGQSAQIGHQTLVWSHGPWPEARAGVPGRKRVDAFHWLMRAASCGIGGAQAILGDRDLRTYIVGGAGSQDWRGASARALMHTAVVQPHAGSAWVDLRRRANQIAQEVVVTAGREDVDLGPDAKRAVAEVLAAYMPYVFMGMDGAAVRLEKTDLAERFYGNYPKGDVAFDEEALETALSRVLTDPTAGSTVAEAFGRYGWELLTSCTSSGGFVDIAEVVGEKIRQLGALSVTGATEEVRQRQAIQNVAYTEMRMLAGLTNLDPTGVLPTMTGPVLDAYDTHRDAERVGEMDREVKAVETSEQNKSREWGVAVLRMYQQFVAPDSPTGRWLQERLPDPPGTLEDDWRTVGAVAQTSPENVMKNPVFEGHQEEAEDLGDLLGVIRRTGK